MIRCGLYDGNKNCILTEALFFPVAAFKSLGLDFFFIPKNVTVSIYNLNALFQLD